jgi:asparagine synthase (glutamine-hydrolysing)
LPIGILRAANRKGLRRLLYKFVPKELVERPNMGFGVPIDSWVRGKIRGSLERM